MMRTTAEAFGRAVRLLDHGTTVTVAYSVGVQENGLAEHLYTVVGDLPGSDPRKAGEYVMVTGHLDSWLGGSGAIDNGAGAATAIEALRILAAAKVPLKRTVRAALFAGEEQGLLCSTAYAKNHVATAPRDESTQRDVPVEAWRSITGPVNPGADYARISAVINVDGGSGRVRAILNGGHNPALAAKLSELAAPLSDLGILKVFDDANWPADEVSFTTLGIPGITFLQDPLDYDTRVHHTELDTPERIEAGDLAQVATVTAALLAGIANADSLMPREPQGDGRAARLGTDAPPAGPPKSRTSRLPHHAIVQDH